MGILGLGTRGKRGIRIHEETKHILSLKQSRASTTKTETGELITVRDGHGGGWSRKINAWHLYTLMVYL